MKNAMIKCCVFFVFLGVVTLVAIKLPRIQEVQVEDAPLLDVAESVLEEDVVALDEKAMELPVEPEVVVYPDELLALPEKTEDAEKKASEKAVPPKVERRVAVITYRLPEVITSVSCGGPGLSLPKKRRFSEEGILEEVPPEEIECGKKAMTIEHGMPQVISRISYPDGQPILPEKTETSQEENKIN